MNKYKRKPPTRSHSIQIYVRSPEDVEQSSNATIFNQVDFYSLLTSNLKGEDTKEFIYNLLQNLEGNKYDESEHCISHKLAQGNTPSLDNNDINETLARLANIHKEKMFLNETEIKKSQFESKFKDISSFVNEWNLYIKKIIVIAESLGLPIIESCMEDTSSIDYAFGLNIDLSLQS
ncbi:hypothetical protein M9Y10_018974 [Tritrichomonas musculus]|uniref:Uncharacterized protein n=1 Tax=Tritrichomonas musculus TaxID=1915356 RepID=A0ABR2HI77_9EUKA